MEFKILQTLNFKVSYKNYGDFLDILISHYSS